jgi:hypothetical protein
MGFFTLSSSFLILLECINCKKGFHCVIFVCVCVCVCVCEIFKISTKKITAPEIIILSNRDALYFFLLPNFYDQDIQYYIELKWQ